MNNKQKIVIGIGCTVLLLSFLFPIHWNTGEYEYTYKFLFGERSQYSRMYIAETQWFLQLGIVILFTVVAFFFVKDKGK